MRELENTLERLSAQLGEGGVITFEQVNSEIRFTQPSTSLGDNIEYRAVLRAGESLDEHLNRQQLKIYEMVREHVGGNHSQAARGWEWNARHSTTSRSGAAAGGPFIMNAIFSSPN